MTYEVGGLKAERRLKKYLGGGIGRVGARPRRAASLRGEQEALRRDCDAVPEAGGENSDTIYWELKCLT